MTPGLHCVREVKRQGRTFLISLTYLGPELVEERREFLNEEKLEKENFVRTDVEMERA